MAIACRRDEGHGWRCDRRRMENGRGLSGYEFPETMSSGTEGSMKSVLLTIVVAVAMCSPAAAQYSSEAGFAILQQNCMTCHGQASAPRAPSVGVLRDLSPERIYEVLNMTGIAAHQSLKLSDDDKKSVAESTTA